ncbi:restriction endonuclease [Lysobacter sp. S4-A87]|uniref:restriction endonuclease n=1 Tax=Lysobacter sp. S4-A87 TaxID=2925843 RepID=UPI001F53A3CC|nr:restriction endonuclease [Lysobacter sp. S4-A87]UNK48013.1 restriction endonuclease [Lysobacter sp. S4-A87]
MAALFLVATPPSRPIFPAYYVLSNSFRVELHLPGGRGALGEANKQAGGLVKKFRMGCFYRYARPMAPDEETVDGLPNFHHIVSVDGMPTLQLERGINSPAPTFARDGERLSVILLASNENKLGSAENPWHDTIEPDAGFARYFGDNKTPDLDPGYPKGNRQLLQQFDLHTSPDRKKRERAAPILLFRSSRKGYKEFAGLSVITGAKRVTQYSERNGGYFTNYLFDLAIVSLTDEKESVDMAWIASRREKGADLTAANALAPKAWREWIQYGSAELEGLRRRVARYHIVSKKEQVAPTESTKRKALDKIYSFYDGRKHRFEALASLACESMIRDTGASYRRGWLTRGTGDGGLDFVGRIDVGEGISRTKLVVLGQAKCEKVDTPTGGVHIARTVARLRRGWLGAYVTTSFFSDAVQREIYEDQYPVMLINGSNLVDETTKLQLAAGLPTIEDFLKHVDSTYEDQVSSKLPEEILWD